MSDYYIDTFNFIQSELDPTTFDQFDNKISLSYKLADTKELSGYNAYTEFLKYYNNNNIHRNVLIGYNSFFENKTSLVEESDYLENNILITNGLVRKANNLNSNILLFNNDIALSPNKDISDIQNSVLIQNKNQDFITYKNINDSIVVGYNFLTIQGVDNSVVIGNYNSINSLDRERAKNFILIGNGSSYCYSNTINFHLSTYGLTLFAPQFPLTYSNSHSAYFQSYFTSLCSHSINTDYLSISTNKSTKLYSYNNNILTVAPYYITTDNLTLSSNITTSYLNKDNNTFTVSPYYLTTDNITLSTNTSTTVSFTPEFLSTNKLKIVNNTPNTNGTSVLGLSGINAITFTNELFAIGGGNNYRWYIYINGVRYHIDITQA